MISSCQSVMMRRIGECWGNSVNATSAGETVMILDRVELASFGGGPAATYTFVHQSALIEPACTDTFHSGTIEVVLLTQVVLPDGSSYDATYYTNGVLSARLHDCVRGGRYGWLSEKLPKEDNR
jgi:hypothetical protein